MADDRTIGFARAFDAPRAAVWQALADPQRVVHWWGPRGCSITVQQMDVRDGGTWAYVLHAWGANVLCRATFGDVTAPERLVFAQDDFVASWTFKDAGGTRTALEVNLSFPTAARRTEMARNQVMMNGVAQSLDRLGEYLARPAVN
jgi:uncharacterized protein YndB with AHSA1/START domain